MNRHRRAGFTLIELLIVVAIIGILAAIAVPNFLNAQTRAKVARAQSELKSIANSISVYLLDNNNKIFPDHNDLAGVRPGGVGNGVPEGYSAAQGNVPVEYHNLQAWKKLTTPIAYMSGIPEDPFWAGLVYGYDAQRDPIGGREIIHNWIAWSIGPDRKDGQWFRPFAIYYMSSNGLRSGGDIFLTPDYSNVFDQRGAGQY